VINPSDRISWLYYASLFAFFSGMVSCMNENRVDQTEWIM